MTADAAFEVRKGLDDGYHITLVSLESVACGIA